MNAAPARAGLPAVQARQQKTWASGDFAPAADYLGTHCCPCWDRDDRG